METIKINCPECNHTMEYWTKNNHIYCTKCKAVIEVEPCKEEVEEELTEEELTKEDITEGEEVAE